MRTLRTAGVAFALLLSIGLFAQEFPKAEVGVTYSYLRYTPAPTYTPSMNGNGGGGSFTFNVNRYFGIEAELMGVGLSKAHWTVPAGNQYAPNGASITSSGNLFTYLFGPRIRIPASKVNPYFDFLFGGAHTSAFNSALAACTSCTTKANPSGNAFGMSIGGGLDVPVNHVVAIRVGQIDYLYTRFNNGLTGTHGQNNFRYQAGAVFRFGGAPAIPPAAACVAPSGELLPDDPPLKVSVSPQNFNPKHTLTYNWTSNAGKVTGNGNSATIDLTDAAPGSYTARADVVDPKAKNLNSASCTVSFTVKQPTPPQVSCGASPGTIHPGDPVSITVGGNTPDGRPITERNFVASAGTVKRANSAAEPETGSWTSSATLDSTGVQPGPLNVTVSVKDVRGLTGTCVASVNVEALPIPQPPPAPVASSAGQCDFKNGQKPARVDNACKAVLDGVALRLQNSPEDTLVLVGFATEDELAKAKTSTVSLERARNIKKYLVEGEGKQQIDPSRISVRTSDVAGDSHVELYSVPAGATFAMEKTTVVDETQAGK